MDTKELVELLKPSDDVSDENRKRELETISYFHRSGRARLNIAKWAAGQVYLRDQRAAEEGDLDRPISQADLGEYLGWGTTGKAWRAVKLAKAYSADVMSVVAELPATVLRAGANWAETAHEQAMRDHLLRGFVHVDGKTGEEMKATLNQYLNGESVQPTGPKYTKSEMLRRWRNLTASSPDDGRLAEAVTPLPADAEGSRFGSDGITIEGSPQAINAWLSRMKDLLDLEDEDTYIDISHRRVHDRVKPSPNAAPDAEAVSIRFKKRSG